MESIEKLREAFEKCTHPIKDEMIEFDTVWIVKDCATMMLDDIEAEIERDYMKLPVDADGVPIHVGDEITLPNGSRDKVRFITIREHDVIFNERGWVSNRCTHVKQRTVEDVLRELVECAEMPGEKLDDGDIEAFADEIRKMFGGDAS